MATLRDAGLIVMTELTGRFLGVQKLSLHGGSVGVVTDAATLEDRGFVGVDLGKIRLLMAVEAAAFEDKTAAPV